MANEKLHPKIAQFRSAIEKRTKIPSSVFVDPSFKLKYINSGSTVMNMLIGGSRLPDGSFVCPGWPRGSIVELIGRESSGKSTIALTAMGQAIYNDGKNDGVGLYIDLECAVKDYYAARLGCDFRPQTAGGTGRALRAQPRTFEETEALVINAALSNFDVIVIDSVAGLVSTREAKRDTSDEKDKQGIAEVPRLMSQFLPKLQNIIARTGTSVIFINQTRDKIGAFGYTEEAKSGTTGGNSLKFWAAIRVWLKPKQSAKAKVWNPILKEKEEVSVSTDIEVKMHKNKIDAKQGHSGLITIRYGVGIDEIRTMLNVAEAYNIIKKTKNARKQEVYVFKSDDGNEIEAIGLEKFRREMQVKEEGKYLNEMLEKSRHRLIEGYKMLDDDQLAELADQTSIHHHKSEDDDEEEMVSDKGLNIIDYDELTDGSIETDGSLEIDEIDKI